MNSAFINDLLAALEKEEVVLKIQEITTQKHTTNPPFQKEEKSEKKSELYKKITSLEKELAESKALQKFQEESLLQLKSKLQHETDNKTKIEQEYLRLQNKHAELFEQHKTVLQERNHYKENYEPLESIHNLFLNLSPNTKQSLVGIFKGMTIHEFLSCGVQYENLDSLWEYMKRETIEGSNQDLDSLNEIFRFFFHAYNKIYDSPIYEIQSTSIGQRFDEDLHIRGGNSKVIGEISSVLLNGYYNRINNKIIKKSIVQI
ncbi:hypothetical protein [Evansella tamaricis]|uniref:Uncharacterized protein n=1 Tax=Evansella tamaricis TaxID=2069301 RepID=A0ABS6JGE5_9BACI|nr:hypothetical protein [Evansella tamaricis]MBU9712739.1 hypothetical protein [Evansella tamaricis]